MREGVLLRFDVALDKDSAADPARYQAASWGYKRTFRYGSPNYKADGTTGVDPLVPSRAYVSADGRGVFVATPDMRPVMQLRVGWKVRCARRSRRRRRGVHDAVRARALQPACGRLRRHRPRPDPPGDHGGSGRHRSGQRRRGPRRVRQVRMPRVPRDRTRHGDQARPDRSRVCSVAARPIAGRTAAVVADEAYLRQSIREPTAAVVAGFDRPGVGMPSFAGVLSDAQVESVILFLKSLK